jgi:hypothetical protein
LRSIDFWQFSQKIEQKSQFANTVLSHFLPNIESFNIKKIGKFFPHVFKIAMIFKMEENWFFDHNSVSFEHFCVLFFDLS